MDYRGVLHRDGSVFSTITPKDLKNPDLMYRGLGFKTAVGMPFKDVATSDSLILTEAPEMDDDVARTAIRRMQEVGVGMLLDAAELEAKPVPNAVAIMPVADVLAGKAAPDCAGRVAAVLDGSETEEQIVALKGLDDASKPVVIILDVPAKLSRLHASRRVIELLRKNEVALPVHRYYVANEDDNLALSSASPGRCWWTASSKAIGNAPGFNFDLDFCAPPPSACCRAAACAPPRPSSCRARLHRRPAGGHGADQRGRPPRRGHRHHGVHRQRARRDGRRRLGNGRRPQLDLYAGKEVTGGASPTRRPATDSSSSSKYGMWKEKEEEEVLDEELVAA